MVHAWDDRISARRSRGRIVQVSALIFGMLICIGPSSAGSCGEPLSRSELADFLAAAEGSRGWFRIHIVHHYEFEYEGMIPGDEESALDMLTDGSGRFRTSSRSNHSGLTSTVVWDQVETRTLGEMPPGAESAPPYLSITENYPNYHLTDNDLWPILGLMLDTPVGKLTPLSRASEILADASQPVEISEVTEQGRVLTKLVLRNPFQLVDDSIVFSLFYDSARDWLLVRYLVEASNGTAGDAVLAYSNEMRVVESAKVDGVWMPHRVQDFQTLYVEDPVGQYETTIRLSDIELRPPVRAEDFTISVSSLPQGASVVDSRLGISYKLGQNLVYMDGHLNEVAEPIEDEITPAELKRIMKNATALIDPVALANESKLSPVQVKGRLARLSTWGFGLMGLGLATFGIVIWRRSQG